jgi:uncharacterized protein involved in response to NO
MIFGFVAAALAGFLLTAVASWTEQRGFAGPPLMILAAVWLGGSRERRRVTASG